MVRAIALCAEGETSGVDVGGVVFVDDNSVNTMSRRWMISGRRYGGCRVNWMSK